MLCLDGLNSPSNLRFLQTPVGWGCRIHRLHHSRRVRPPQNEYRRYDTKGYDSEVPLMQDLRGIQSTPSLTSLSIPLWPEVIAPDRALSMGQIERNCVLMLSSIVWNGTVLGIETVLTLNWIVWNRTICIKMDLALNYLQRLICHKTQPTFPSFWTVPNAPITIGITITLMFYSFHRSLGRSKFLSLVLLSLIFALYSTGTVKSTIWQVLFFFITGYSLLVEIRSSVCILKFQRI